jgi:phosphoenolpyruvate synthase/pyruvate phosphate dikinase
MLKELMKKMKSLAEILSSSKSDEEVYSSENKKRFWRAKKGYYSRDPHLFDFIHLVKSWEAIVGKMLAENTVPLRIKNNDLYIATKHSIFSQELGFMGPMIIEKIEHMFPAFNGKIKKIRFTHSNYSSDEFNELKGQKVQNQKEKKPAPHPFDPKFRARKMEVEEMFKDVEDDEVRKLLISITLTE